MRKMTTEELSEYMEDVPYIEHIGLLISIWQNALPESEQRKSVENRIAELLPSKLSSITDLDIMVFIWNIIPMRVGMYYPVEERFAEVLSSELPTITDMNKLTLLLEMTMGSEMAVFVMNRIAELEQRQL